MGVRVHCEQDRAVPQSLFRVDDQGAALAEQRAEGVTEIVQGVLRNRKPSR